MLSSFYIRSMFSVCYSAALCVIKLMMMMINQKMSTLLQRCRNTLCWLTRWQHLCMKWCHGRHL